jgi:transcriptional regulator of acetoin/glycerol metabolism
MKQLSTTLPSARTLEQVSASHPTHVSWVFPRALSMRVPPLSVVGRDETCTVVLTGTEVSRRHAEFRVDGTVLSVRDLGSRNGTLVDGVQCNEARLEVGSVVRCGEWVGVVTSSSAEHDPAEVGFGELAPGLLGGARLARALAPVKRIATSLPVIVQGRTGTGKEGAARAVHTWSQRAGRFVAVNCAAIPESLAEAHLFGHLRGAFTGADRATQGLFREADRGSLFLDEVLELPRALQAKLLRVIEEKVVYPLGEARGIPVDVRIIVAAQEPVDAAVVAGRFRADLYARLNGLTVVLPTLAERREDIVPLFLHFLEAASGPSTWAPKIDAKLAEALCLFDWPSNVRELLLLASRLKHLHGAEANLRRSHLPARMLARVGAARPGDDREPPDQSGPVHSRVRKRTDDESEFGELLRALRDHRAVAAAAESIGISRDRAYRLIKAHPEFSLDDFLGRGP